MFKGKVIAMLSCSLRTINSFAIMMFNIIFSLKKVIYVKNAASQSISENPEELNNIVIFEICEADNTYKQLSIEEFLSKLKKYESNINSNENIICYGELRFSVDRLEAYRGSEKIILSPREYKMLKLFFDNKGKILSNEQIINCIWGVAYANSGMLRVAIKRLRSKIDPQNKYLKTIRGKGYKFVDL